MSEKATKNKPVVAKKFVLKKHFEGKPKPSDLSLVEEELPPIKDGGRLECVRAKWDKWYSNESTAFKRGACRLNLEFLVQAEYLSVDPYMRKYSDRLPLDATMIGCQVGVVIESRNPDYPVGKRIVGHMGWRTHTIMHPDRFVDYSLTGRLPYLMPDYGDLPASVSLGVLGQPGLTAYFGFMEICEPVKGETAVVSGAAGAVGSIVGQMAKLQGLNVIGIAGTDEKCTWLVKELGFDFAINYKTQNVRDELKKAAPQGIDCYFDNVGGEISSTVLYQMNPFGRVAVCGSISSYNSDASQLPKCTLIQLPAVANQLTIKGFLVARWKDRQFEGFKQIYAWIRDGKLRYQETITEGFDNMFQAFVGMMNGENLGKAIVNV